MNEFTQELVFRHQLLNYLKEFLGPMHTASMLATEDLLKIVEGFLHHPNHVNKQRMQKELEQAKKVYQQSLQ